MLLGDLPCLTPEEVAGFIERGRSLRWYSRPTSWSEGTNGFWSTCRWHAFCVWRRESEPPPGAGRETGETPDSFQAPGIGFDVDTFADLSMLYEFGIWMPEDHEEPRARPDLVYCYGAGG